MRHRAVLTLGVVIWLVMAASAMAAAPTLYWSVPKPDAGTGWQAHWIDCSPGICGQVSGGGDPGNYQSYVEAAATVTSADPAWSDAPVLTQAGDQVQRVSCPLSTLCVAADDLGNVFYSADPTASAAAWHDVTGVGTNTTNELSCPSASLCALADGSGHVHVTTDPTGPASSWTSTDVATSGGLSGIACSAQGLCVAWNASGVIYRTADASGGSWTSSGTSVDADYITDGSCAGTALCTLSDDSGDVLISDDGGASWTSHALAAGRYLSSVSCPSTGFCAVADEQTSATASTSDVFLTGDPTDTTPLWSTAALPGFGDNVSCASASLCAAETGQGFIVGTTYQIGVPAVTIGESQSDSDTAQTLGATVNPDGDPVTNCQFDYGSSNAYGLSIPCSPLPGSGSAAVQVSAVLNGLTAGDTYHYRIEATNSYGTTFGEDATFVAGAIGSSGPGGGGGGGGGSGGSGSGSSCVQSVRLTQVIVAQGCFSSHLGLLVSTADVRINGIDFTPGPAGVVSVGPNTGRVDLAGTGLVHAGDVPLETWAGITHLDFSASQFQVPLGQVQKIGASLFGFPFVAPVEIAFGSDQSAQITAIVNLKILGDPIGGSASLGTSNSGGLQINSVNLSVGGSQSAQGKSLREGVLCYPSTPPPAGWQCNPDPRDPQHGTLAQSTGYLVNLGGKLPLQNLSCSFMRINQQGNYGASGQGQWSCSATVGLNSLFGGVSIGGVSPSLTLGASVLYPPIAFNGGTLGISGVNIPLGAVAVLHSVNFTIQLHPQLTITGQISLGAGPPVETDVNNRLFTINGQLQFQLGSQSGFELQVTGNLLIAPISQQIAKGQITWNGENGKSELSASLTVALNIGKLISGSAHIGGAVTGQHFQLLGSLSATILGQSIQGQGVVSDLGVGGCGSVHIAFWSGSVGAEYVYSQKKWDYDGCVFQAIEPLGSAGAAAAAGQPAVIDVPKGMARLEIAATGVSAPPQVELEGPRGVQVTTPATPDQLTATGQVLAVAVSESDRTYFVVDHPAAGQWRVVTLGGATPPLSVGDALPLQPVDAHVRISVRSHRFTLHWRLRAQPGVAVEFLERGRGVAGTIAAESRASGSVSFTPTQGPAGRRQVLALVTVNGIGDGDPVVVGHYTAPAPARAHVRRASYEVAGHAVLVLFTPVRGASGYEVSAVLRRGGAERRLVDARARTTALLLPSGAVVRRVLVAPIVEGVLEPATRATLIEAPKPRRRRSSPKKAARRPPSTRP